MKEFIQQSIVNRGPKETLTRVATVINRYGIYKNKFFENMEVLTHILEEYDAKATIPITAKVLSENPNFHEFINNDRIEFAIHGYKHLDYTQLSYEEIVFHLNKSIDIFRENGIKAYGFRAPYLKINNTIINAIKDVGLKYDSSYTVCFDVVSKGSENYLQVDHLIKLYNPKYSLPVVSKIGGIIEIPVALPDDEMLLDRLKFTPKKVAECWIAAMKKSIEVNESVFVLQIHPERVLILKDALTMVIEWAVCNNIEIIKLSEITEGGIKPGNHYLAITGDIDIIQLLDILDIIGR